MDETVEFKTKGLDQLIRSMKGNIPVVKVGILAETNSRKNGEGSNASIGVKHEFGMEGLPERSFLRVPLAEHMQDYLNSAEMLDRATVAQIIQEGSLERWLTKVGFIAENIISDAFSTGGFGKWKPSNMAYKKVHLTLVETQQLRNSITSEVVG